MSEPTNKLSQYYPLLSPIVVILTFLVNALISKNIRKKEVLRSWFTKSIIEPNNEKIEDFFQEVNTLFQKAYKKLNSTKGVIDKSQYQKLHVNYNRDFKKLKKDFEFNYIDTIKATNIKTSQALDLILQNIEDDFVKNLDSVPSPNDIPSHFERSLLAYKSLLYKEIYILIKEAKFY